MPTSKNPEELRSLWRERIQQAREDRARVEFEPTWLSNLAFAAGKFYLVWNRQKRTLEFPEELKGQELYAADKITEPRQRALSELGGEEDQPELLLVQDGEWAEDFQQQANRAVSHGWEHEWLAAEALGEADEITVDMGTAAIRTRFDPTVGPVRQEQVPFVNGKPVLDPEEARALLAGGPRPDVQMRTIREGRTRWEVGSPFNLLVPPGITRERDFPWEIWVRPVHLDKLREEYGDAAKDLQEDGDIGSILGVTAGHADSIYGADHGTGSSGGRLRNHAWLFTCYERPCPEYPNGQAVHLATNETRLLRVDDELPYQGPDGSYRSGIVYLHWWRRTDTFWSRALIEPMKDPQRGINRRGTQIGEIIDRGMPYLVAEEGTQPARSGKPLEIVTVKKGETAPIPVQGMSPGPWMNADLERMEKDLADASGISEVSLGDNPVNVKTYGQLLLLAENDQKKREKIRQGRTHAIRALVENSVYDIRRYWGADKQLLLTSQEDEDRIEAEVFNATRIPDFFVVKVAKGAARPRSQAAEFKKIEDLWGAAVKCGVAVNDQRWLRWYYESLEAGQPLPIPEQSSDDQVAYAELENRLLTMGEQAPVAYYHPPAVHIPVHRLAQDQALMQGDEETFVRIDDHIREHEARAAEQAAEIAALQAPPVMPGPELPEAA